MPRSTIAAAEKAAIEGDLPDIDTWACHGLQEFLLSSPKTPSHVASQNISAAAIGCDKNAESEAEEEEEEVNDDDEDTAGDDPENADESKDTVDERSRHESANIQAATVLDEGIHQVTQSPLHQAEAPPGPAEDGLPVKQQLVPRTHMRSDSKGKLRAVAGQGKVVRQLGLDSQHQAAMEETQRRHELDELTPKSSMSPTQENPASAYDRFDIQQILREDCPSTANTDNADGRNPTSKAASHDSIVMKQQHGSAWTDSTVHTYGEHEIGHVELNYEPGIMDDEDQSQDASFAVPQLGVHFAVPSYEPQTPAAPVNPFSQKGSVMKGSDLFGATQPSSIARFASPTSSRPSPADIYTDFTSPPKRQRITSSPLTRLNDEGPLTSPLQSSVRVLLATSVSADIPVTAIPRTSGVQSFDVARGNSPPAPRPYVSMKESQERRRDSLDADSDTDGSDSAEVINHQRKRNRESRIKLELSTVALPVKRAPASNQPQSSTSPAVEVPSTGRRRSIQEDYLAQCDGYDARETQQDDYIADSQGGSNRNNDQSQPSHASLQNGGMLSARLNLDGESVSDTPCRPRHAVRENIIDSSKAMLVPVEGSETDQLSQPDDLPHQSLPGPSLPLNESSGNRSSVRTPLASKTNLLSDGPDTVPETSPPEQRIPALGAIAEISFRESQLNIDELPGFSQDVEFERAVDPGSPKMPIPRPRSFRHDAAPYPALPAVPVVAAPILGNEKTEFSEPVNALRGEEQSHGIVTVKITTAGSNVEKLQLDEVSKPDSVEIEVAHAMDATYTAVAETDGIDREENLDLEATGNDGDAQDDSMPEAKLSGREENATLIPEPEDSHAEELAPRRAGSEKKGASSSLKTYAKGKRQISSGQRKSRASTVRASSKAEATSTPTPSPRSDPWNGEGSVTRRQSARAKLAKQSTPAPVAKRTLRHSAGTTPAGETTVPTSSTRASKKKLTVTTAREDSENPRAITPIPANKSGRSAKSMSGLFENMAFAVSYVKNDQERNKVIKLITEYGGLLLEDGFDALFNIIPKAADQEVELTLSDAASSLGFTALIADEHSRKNKFMQALALGLPCISGRWVSQCVAKMAIVDWTPYLLSAGQSSFLGNAVRSRVLAPYPASDAVFADVFSNRERLLEGKSILLITGKGKTEETRKAYVFLTRALGPARVGQAVDFLQARKRLVETQGTEEAYDFLYVEKDAKAADSVVFGAASTSRSSKKRKRAVERIDADLPIPKKIRIIGDETMIQSLILGQLLDEESG